MPKPILKPAQKTGRATRSEEDADMDTGQGPSESGTRNATVVVQERDKGNTEKDISKDTEVR